MKSKQSVGSAMRLARAGAGLSLRSLAALLGVSPQFLHDVEHDRRFLPERHFEKLPPTIREAIAEAKVRQAQDNLAEARAQLHRMRRLGQIVN